ncbi:urea carboxylase-associated family protein [Streptomyces sp. NBC_01476]|uniref:urea amidolyase associated protein UAAP1 n=1 Tax=Streptomyces sp. NBC_01476 TaxID=2903881 RepID=UPI002E35E0B7|nr:urea amidolyase associated protein UAAP1 [Streptomyces sp. NBC_01476]
MPKARTGARTGAKAEATTGTTSGARDHARAQEGSRADAMPIVPPPDGLLWAETVAGGGYTHKALARGTELRLADPTGTACAHLLLFADGRPWERLSTADTTKVQWNAYLGAGSLLLSDQGRVLASLIADTSGRHDALCGTSTAVRNQARYGDGAPHGRSPAGRELFKLAAAKHGLAPRDLPPSLSFFQGVRVEPDGAVEFIGSAGKDTAVTLRAEQPLTVLLANVPHPLDPRPAYTCGPLVVRARRAAPTAPDDPLWDTTPEGRRAFLNTAEHLAARGIA